MTVYQVNAADIGDAAHKAVASASSIRAEVSAMVGFLVSLESSWHGGASTAFSALLAEWRSAQAQLEHALDGIATGLSQAASEYEAAESAAMRMFRH